MKHLVIAIIILWAAFHFGGMFFSARDRSPDIAFGRLLDAPQRSIQNPYRNGYFYLIGLMAASSLDPGKTGYEIWVEETEDASRGTSDERKATRGDLVFTLSSDTTSSAWEADDPLHAFGKKDASFRAAAGQYHILLARYERWLGMPFDDWGFGRKVVPLGNHILAVHRLYVADGFSAGTLQGLQRLEKELQSWRTVLREAKTIESKVLAQILITDDLHLLSRMLSKPVVDKAILAMGLQLTLPLSAAEYSLRWPVRHQLALAVKDGSPRSRSDLQQIRRSSDHDWLIEAAHLPVYAFKSIEHPPAQATMGVFQFGQASKAYAAYYEAIIMASESHSQYLPRMQEVVGTLDRGRIESMLTPRPIEPTWEIFHGELIETDTRLRLASLQIQLRRPSSQAAVPTRLAEVGSQYFDPFTGLPMLWSPTQQKLYSVGKDRLDDGGDPTFDISVPAAVAQTIVKPSAKPAITHSTRQ
ncbi:MAG: hypothetical protein K0S79_2593 [Nitrospira sp.]|jgi:hypothetical protein|nr:hypothetical protein [Nitrospira sp.]